MAEPPHRRPYTYGGRDCQAPLNEPSRHDAIHGLVRWLDWSLLRHDPSQVTLSCAVRPQPGYEWQLDLEITYQLDRAGLTVTLTAVNTDDEPAPFGVGFHPYLTLGTTVDALELTVPATTFLDPDTAGRTRDDDPRGRDAAGLHRGLVGFCRRSWIPRSATSRARAMGGLSPDCPIRPAADRSSCGSTAATAT